MKVTLEKIVKFVLIFLAIFIPFREIIAYFTTPYIKFLPDLIIYILLILTVFRNKFKLNLKIYDYLYIVFLLLGFINSSINHVSIMGYLLQFRSITTMYVLFYILRNVDLDKEDFKLFFKSLEIVGIILVIFAVGEVLTSKCMFYPAEWALPLADSTNYLRAYSLLDNPNVCAFFMLFSVIALNYYDNKFYKIKFLKLFNLFAFIGVFLTSSRSGILAIVLWVLYLIYIAFKNHEFKKLIIEIIIIALSFGLVQGINKIRGKINITCDAYQEYKLTAEKNYTDANYNPISDRFEVLMNGDVLKNSVQDGRVFNIKRGLIILNDYPLFGTGFATYGSAGSKMIIPTEFYNKYGIDNIFCSDNEYIKVLVENGIIGTIIYCIFVIALFLINKKEPFNYLLFAIFLWAGMFFNIFEVCSICMLFYILINIMDKDKKEVRS